MPAHYNSASRLLSHFDALLNSNNGESTVDAWAKIFKIEEPDGNRKVFKVAERLCVLNDELERMEATLTEAGRYEHDLHSAPFTVARRAISPQLLNGNIDQAKSFIANEVRTPFRFMVSALPSEEREFEGEDLTDLVKLITELQSTISASTLAPHILAIVKNHIALLLRGIALYPIQGPLALRQALKYMAVDFIENRQDLQENHSATEIGLLETIWMKAQTMTAAASASDYIAVGTLTYEAGKLIGRMTGLTT